MKVRSVALVACIASATQAAHAQPLSKAEEDQDIVVTARPYPIETSSGSKSDLPILLTPQAINTITAEEIAVRGVQSLTQAIQNTPGVVGQYGDTDVRHDWIIVRGFNPVRYLDGMRLPFGARGYAQIRIEPYGLERIEVLKGPASSLYGQSAPGGLINMVSKRPTDQPLHEVLLQAGSFDRFQGGIDFGGPIGDTALSYRLTGLVRTSDTPTDYLNEKRVFIAPSLRFAPDDRTSITLLGQYQKIVSDGGGAPPALPVVGTLRANPVGQISRSLFIGDPGYDHFRNEQFTAGVELRRDLSEALRFEQNIRYADVTTDTQRVQGIALAADNRTLSRYAWAFPERSHVWTTDTRLHLRGRTGEVTHDALIGLDYQYERARYDESALRLVPSIDVFAPVYTRGTVRPPIATTIRQNRDQTGIYGQYNGSLGRLSLLASGRYDWADSTTNSLTVASNRQTQARQSDRQFTGRIGLTYRVLNDLAAYASYGTSFQPTAGTDRLGQAFAPSLGKQWEGGVKYQFRHLPGLITLAVFDLRQTNVTTPDPVDIRFNTQTGEARVRGVEAEAKFTPVHGLNLIASYAYSESKVLQANRNAAGASIQGNALAFVPDHQASARADYSFPSGALKGVGIGAGVTYFGSLYGDAANLYRIPAATIADAALRFDLASVSPALKGANLALNVSNVFDRRYLKTCISATGCYFGAPRTALLSLRYAL
ncbi:TonB-dependent siderophore receptor [Sphingomonas sanguinis]|uniref:TonB-dependent siderophore receptor n=1 Tax=Sphingomonas sanguinis TaxID=33051 RepID=A0ABU5LR97_9SPHN|nr:TonB-dependent siderophore receptor [Sphingomonas sanguinis]MDZ7282276.1 TonB-dependent siderophore receptor [Sphingomonas sanguinis]